MADAPDRSGDSTHSSLMVLMFTDIVGSVSLKARLGGQAYRQMVAQHDRIYREIIGSTRGAQCLKDTGDGFLSRFVTASDAVAAALRFQHALATRELGPEPLRVRIGIHVGEVEEVANDIAGLPKIVGLAADIAARVMGLAQGGQILLTRTAYDSARQYVREHPPVEGLKPAVEWKAHGRYRFDGWDEAMDIFEVGAVGVAPLSPPPDGGKARRESTAAAVGSDAPARAVADRASAAFPWQPIAAAAALLAALLAGWGFMRSDSSTRQTPAEPQGAAVHASKAQAETNAPPPAVQPDPDPRAPAPAPPAAPPKASVREPDLIEAKNANAAFEVALKTGEAKAEYVEGEHITFIVQVPRDAYVTLIAVDPEGHRTLLLPNAWNVQGRAAAGEAVVVPPPMSGSRFPIQPPHGRNRVIAIATPRPLALRGVDEARLLRDQYVDLGPARERSSATGQWIKAQPLIERPVADLFKAGEWSRAELTITTRAP